MGVWVQRWDSNPRHRAYEARELAAVLLCRLCCNFYSLGDCSTAQMRRILLRHNLSGYFAVGAQSLYVMSLFLSAVDCTTPFFRIEGELGEGSELNRTMSRLVPCEFPLFYLPRFPWHLSYNAPRAALWSRKLDFHQHAHLSVSTYKK